MLSLVYSNDLIHVGYSEGTDGVSTPATGDWSEDICQERWPQLPGGAESDERSW